MAVTYDKLAPEYATLWDGMVIGDRIKAAIDRMLPPERDNHD